MPQTSELPAFAAGSRLLNVKQTMELLNCRSRNTLARYVKRGWLRPIKMGKHRQSPSKFRFDEVMYSLENLRHD